MPDIAKKPLVIDGNMRYLIRHNPRVDVGLSEEDGATFDNETIWEIVDEEPFLSDPQAVVANPMACPLCFGTQRVNRLHRGGTSGLEVDYPTPCPCILARVFFKHWHNSKVVPERFRWVKLDTLQVYPELRTPERFQKAILQTLRKNPTDSYLFTGPAGTGKTTLSTALYRHAIYAWSREVWQTGKTTEAVWRTSLNRLMRQFHFQEIGQAVEQRDLNGQIYREAETPAVTVQAVQAAINAGYRPCLFLEELDKFNPTEFKSNILLDLVNLVYEAKGQIVATSNRSAAELDQMLGSVHGDTLLRRICDDKTENSIAFPTTG
jgi:hypothetical protein